ncbi:hypothetical protein DFR58_10143 [Anaerobacterium chartisolvens]|uniref:Alpha/beta hydrolase family protein n=1 Tax=Anaerobacterium chartisolvens TaxID=1297424 RepID=A0A369BHF9_9FIRM|nr:alpha/beta hydrolase [Anaerobacterium chartisolvens]RCX20841.1 hypothetical protein DFR58_10143 [Anaerobacterium chartisolvens]
MNKILADFIDKYALYMLHRKRSSFWQFKNSIEETEYFDVFYSSPDLPDIKFQEKDQLNGYSMGRYSFKSQMSTVDICNINSSGLYYRSNEGKNSVNVICINGWRSSSHKKLQSIYLKEFMKLNYNIYFVTLPYHMERNSSHALYDGEFMISADIDRTLLAIKQAVLDTRALIRWIKDKNGEVILIGLSLGGLISNLIGVTERKVDKLVSIFYANNLSYTIWDTIPGRYIKADFEKHGFTYEELKRKWQIINPSNFTPVIRKDNILLLTAIYDKYVHKKDSDILWEAWGRPQRVLMNCGHSGIVLCRENIRNSSVSFIRDLRK